MERRKCPQCGTEFEADQPWKRICLDCWRDNKNRKEHKQIEQLQEQVAYWKARAQGEPDPEVGRLQSEVAQYRRLYLDQQYRIASLELALSAEQSRTPSPRYNGTAIPPDMLKRLIQLAHPDRHGGSDAAHRATQWLLEQRRRPGG